MNKFLDLMVDNAVEELIEKGYKLEIVTNSQLAAFLQTYWPDFLKDSLTDIEAAVKRLRERKRGFGK